MLYNKLKEAMISDICVEITNENAHQLHRESFLFGVSNGLGNLEAMDLANDIVNMTLNKSREEIEELTKTFEMDKEKPKRITWVKGNGNYRMVPSRDGIELIFEKLNRYLRGGFFKIYNSVDVRYSHYDCVNIEIHYDDGIIEEIEDFDKREEYESRLIELFVKNRLGLVIDEKDFSSCWTIDEYWGETTCITTFVISSAYTYKFKN